MDCLQQCTRLLKLSGMDGYSIAKSTIGTCRLRSGIGEVPTTGDRWKVGALHPRGRQLEGAFNFGAGGARSDIAGSAGRIFAGNKSALAAKWEDGCEKKTEVNDGAQWEAGFADPGCC